MDGSVHWLDIYVPPPLDNHFVLFVPSLVVTLVIVVGVVRANIRHCDLHSIHEQLDDEITEYKKKRRD